MVGELRRQLQDDLKSSVQGEFGQKIKLAKPNNGEFKDFIGLSNDVSLAIDYETGALVTGGRCQAVFILKEVLDHFGELPNNLWVVEFLEISSQKLRVKDVLPDSSQGLLTLICGSA